MAQTEEPPEEPKAKPKLRFRAKQHFQDLNTNVTQLDGGVVINYGDMELSAGSVTLDKGSGMVTASDNVILRIPSEQTVVKAHKIIFDYRSQTGEFINVYIKSGVARLRAKKAIKVGPKKYELFKGTFTTCDVPEDEACPWKIWSYKTKVTLDGYATAEHPIFMISGVPVLYSPFTFFPVKRNRQSGFLMPNFGASDQSGITISKRRALTSSLAVLLGQ